MTGCGRFEDGVHHAAHKRVGYTLVEELETWVTPGSRALLNDLYQQNRLHTGITKVHPG